MGSLILFEYWKEINLSRKIGTNFNTGKKFLGKSGGLPLFGVQVKARHHLSKIYKLGFLHWTGNWIQYEITAYNSIILIFYLSGNGSLSVQNIFKKNLDVSLKTPLFLCWRIHNLQNIFLLLSLSLRPPPTALPSVWLFSTKSLAASKPGVGNESTFRWAWLGWTDQTLNEISPQLATILVKMNLPWQQSCKNAWWVGSPSQTQFRHSHQAKTMEQP